MEKLGVLEDLEDVSSSKVYRASVGDRLQWLGLPYTVDSDDIIALFRSDYLPGFPGSGPYRTVSILTSGLDLRDFGDFFFALASQDDVAHVFAFTHESPSKPKQPTAPELRFAAKFPLSRAPEFLEALAEALFQPHSKRSFILHDSINSLAECLARDCRRHRVEVYNITPDLLRILDQDPNELARLTPETFEQLVADRLTVMGMGVKRVGKANQKDGGIDIVAWPEQSLSFPFLLVVQVKHSRTARSIGPSYVRDLQGVLSRLPCEVGMLVTNTTFTADAKWVASHSSSIIRLRDFFDVMRWIRGDFLSELPWKEIPESLKMAPGIMIKIPKWRFFIA